MQKTLTIQEDHGNSEREREREGGGRGKEQMSAKSLWILQKSIIQKHALKQLYNKNKSTHDNNNSNDNDDKRYN